MTRSRIRLLSWFIIIVSLVLIAKLYDVQIVNGQSYKDRANRQYVQPSAGVFDRGSIYFTTKDGTEVAAASLMSGFTLALNPKNISNPEDVYNKLSSVVELDQVDFLFKANKHNDPYEEIMKRLPQDKADAINVMKIPGVLLAKDRWRVYPGKSLAAQTLGFVSYSSKNNTLEGSYGLERYYQNTLSREGDNLYTNFFAELFSDVSTAVTAKQNLQGDIVTSIEPSVQSQLETELQSVMNQYHSKLTGGIIMDPKTGVIYAMGLNPTFDLSNYGAQKNPAIFDNELVQGVYEMGSIMKPLTVAAGIDAGVITASTTYNDAGCIDVNKAHICNYDKKGRGPNTTMQEVLNQSLNTGVAYAVGKLGNARFADYLLNKFALKDITGIDLPNENKPLIANMKSPRDVEYITASFGQGVSFSPIATVRALSVLANGGKLVTPHIAKEIRYKIGVSKQIDTGEGVQTISPSTSEEITRMLVRVVDGSLIKGKYKREHYSVAAKTGTAQLADGKGHYYTDRYLHSFFGYFPAYNPRFIIFLYTVEPQGVEYASHSLTEPFMHLADFLISYYNLPPDR